MKYISFITILAALSLFACKQESSEIEMARVVFLDPGPCCSNLETIGQELIFSELVGYSESILAATNINEFSSIEFQNGDSLSIQFEFSDQLIPCAFICNRHHGIPIKLISVSLL